MDADTCPFDLGMPAANPRRPDDVPVRRLAKTSHALLSVSATITTFVGTTDPGGNFGYKFKPGPKDPTGTWQVQAEATLNGIGGSTTANFTLQ
jgi:hypothetical protein